MNNLARKMKIYKYIYSNTYLWNNAKQNMKIINK